MYRKPVKSPYAVAVFLLSKTFFVFSQEKASSAVLTQGAISILKDLTALSAFNYVVAHIKKRGKGSRGRGSK
jgi:hypothetical protein